MARLLRRKRERSGIRDTDGPIRCDGHLKWVRGFECLIADKHECGSKMHAHHVKIGGSGGAAIKGGDDEAVPLCALAHDEVHRGEQSFTTKYGLRPLMEYARDLWRQSPHRIKMEASRVASEHRRDDE